jgi:RimJ/RimL family protein N-acetyltransferase
LTTVLETARLTLLEMEASDLDFVAEMLSDPAVMRFYPKKLSKAESLAWIERQRARYDADGHGLWLVRETLSGTPVGQVGLIKQHVVDTDLPEIGYLIHRPYWRQGFATEAATAVRDHAFGVLGYPHVVSLIRPENSPSIGVARKLGMKSTGLVVWADREHRLYRVDRAPAT